MGEEKGKIVSGEIMAIQVLPPFDQPEFNSLVSQFGASHPQAQSFAAVIIEWRPGGHLASKEKIRLVAWCKESNDTRAPARAIAREISKVVFDKVLTEYD